MSRNPFRPATAATPGGLPCPCAEQPSPSQSALLHPFGSLPMCGASRTLLVALGRPRRPHSTTWSVRHRAPRRQTPSLPFPWTASTPTTLSPQLHRHPPAFPNPHAAPPSSPLSRRAALGALQHLLGARRPSTNMFLHAPLPRQPLHNFPRQDNTSKQLISTAFPGSATAHHLPCTPTPHLLAIPPHSIPSVSAALPLLPFGIFLASSRMSFLE